MLYYSGIDTQSTVDGTGVRLVIFFSGCKHRCDGCHNPETWNFRNGQEFTSEVKEKIFDIISRSQLISGITLSGGDPLFSAQDILFFLLEFKHRFPDKNVWLYTGFDLKSLLVENNTNIISVLNLCDYVVDGKYDYLKTSRKVPFRGSYNQKIWRNENGEFIDVSNLY